jgi:predicted dehydrogenase
MNRRSFISSFAAASAVLATGARSMAAGQKSRARLGLIGCGWYGGVSLEAFAQHAAVEVVSLCDPNRRFLQRTLETVAKYQSSAPRTFADFREMLASVQHDIVIVATPDHWHALPAIAAMQAGADVFLEKPISLDVIEGEAVVAAARKYGRVVQVNTQRRSYPLYRDARDTYIRSGRLGRIGLVETYSYLGAGVTEPVPDAPVPAHLDYDLWSGPAPLTAFKALKESRGWRNFREYGNGPIGDLGVHMIDKARYLLDLGWPEWIDSSGGIYMHGESSATVSDTQRAVFHYPGLDLTWEHRTWGRSPIPQRHWTDQWGVRFIGQHGTLNLTMYEVVFTPADGGPREGVHLLSRSGDLENVDFSREIAAYQDMNTRHILDFVRAREDRSRPVADVEEGHISTACCVLANLALQLRRPLSYDSATRRVINDDEATRLLARPYREPWRHPDPEIV